MLKVVSMRKQGNKVVETWGFCYLVTIESNVGHGCNRDGTTTTHGGVCYCSQLQCCYGWGSVTILTPVNQLKFCWQMVD